MSKRAQNVITVGIVFVVLGVGLRLTAAKEWFAPPPATSLTEFAFRQAEFARRTQIATECGMWSIGFGLAIIAATIGGWASSNPAKNPG
jgi:hypothetical protein